MSEQKTYHGKIVFRLPQEEQRCLLAEITPQKGEYCGEAYTHIVTVRSRRIDALDLSAQMMCGDEQFAVVGMKRGTRRRAEIEIYVKAIRAQQGRLGMVKCGFDFLRGMLRRCG